MSFPVFPAIPLFQQAQLFIIGLLFAFAGCESQHNGVIDVLTQPPTIVSASVTPSAVLTDSMNIGPFQLPEDILTIILTASVKVGASPSTVGYTLFQDRRLQPLTEGELNNLGVSPDIFASDSIFTGAVTFQINRSFIGNLTLELVPQSSDGIIGTSFLQTIEIQRFNHPPVLSNLQAPDTVRISLQSFVISVQASDPDGAPDIASVTRQTPSGLILNLNDSGTNGDAVAGDGIYTEVVDLDSSTPLGSYSFVFRALDQSNATSNTILHTIIVLQ